MSYVERLDSGVGDMTPERMMQEIDLLRRIRSEHLWCGPNESKNTTARLGEPAGGGAWLILRRSGREIGRGKIASA